MKLLTALAAAVAATALAQDPWVVYPGGEGPGKGKHVVLLAGDEEYRSEEALPMLGKILSERHGFKCTVLFSVDAAGIIAPNNGTSIAGAAALDTADAVIMSLRYRKWPDADLKHFDDACKRGIPIIGLRTSTHAFNGLSGDYKAYNKFGKNVLGEDWVSHWGRHKAEATRGIIESSSTDDALLRGVSDVFGDTDVYEAYPPADAKILIRGQVLKGMKPDDMPADYAKKSRTGGTGINDPMMPVAWSRVHKNENGKENKVLCTTMGSATDLANEGLRRLVVNGVYWGLGIEVPAKADVTFVGDYKPTMYGFNSYVKGVKPSDHALKK
jgi:hypothetical protein